MENMDLDVVNNNAVKIWCDGCYDMAHFGHANSLRQAKALGTHLTVGVHSDQEICQHKGCPPVFTEEERYAMIRSIKWVDEVAEAAPYVTTLETLDKFGCNYCAHGNDVTTTKDGKDTYQEVKDSGRYKEVERTQGVSTTKLIQRILKSEEGKDEVGDTAGSVVSPYTGSTTPFLMTTLKIRQFSEGREPLPGSRVVYAAGTFDLFHPGHLAFLQKAKEMGDFLLVGLYDDHTAAALPGHRNKFPIMTLTERAQTLLSCRYVDDIVFGAPAKITQELLEHFGVSLVVRGKAGLEDDNEGDAYLAPKQKGIYQEIESGSTLTTAKIVERVISQKALYQKRNKDKEQKEVTLAGLTLGPASMQPED